MMRHQAVDRSSVRDVSEVSHRRCQSGRHPWRGRPWLPKRRVPFCSDRAQVYRPPDCQFPSKSRTGRRSASSPRRTYPRQSGRECLLRSVGTRVRFSTLSFRARWSKPELTRPQNPRSIGLLRWANILHLACPRGDRGRFAQHEGLGLLTNPRRGCVKNVAGVQGAG
jgi:hypothetical protein